MTRRRRVLYAIGMARQTETGQVRGKLVAFRLSATEEKELEARKRELAIKSTSAYLRGLIRSDLKRGRDV